MNGERDKNKKLAEIVIKRILNGDVFFAGNGFILEIEKKLDLKFELLGETKLRRFKGNYKLYFIKKSLVGFMSDTMRNSGADYETLLGFVLTKNSAGIPIVDTYFVGFKNDLDRLSYMVYSIFTNEGKSKIRRYS